VCFDEGEAVYIPEKSNTADTPGPSSELLGYRLMLAAIYNDRETFIKLSNTIQAGIWIGSKATYYKYYLDSNGGSCADTSDTNCTEYPVQNLDFNNSGLFPWVWKDDESDESIIECNPEAYGSWDCAGDGDINIALGYIYGLRAFDNDTNVYSYANGGDTCAVRQSSSISTLLENYITAIRENLLYYYGDDTSGTDSSTLGASGVLLQDGYQANNTNQSNNRSLGSARESWHIDYSDLRAFELFSVYDDSTYSTLWKNVYKSTITMYASLLDVDDGRTIMDTNDLLYGVGSGYFFPESKYAPINNSQMDNVTGFGDTNGSISFLDDDSSAYLNVGDYAASRSTAPQTFVTRTSSNGVLGYNSDCCRLPIRLSYYLSGTRGDEAAILEETISKISVNSQRFLADAFATGVPFSIDEASSGSYTRPSASNDSNLSLVVEKYGTAANGTSIGNGTLTDKTALIFPLNYVVGNVDSNGGLDDYGDTTYGFYLDSSIVLDSTYTIGILSSSAQTAILYPTPGDSFAVPDVSGDNSGTYTIKYGSIPPGFYTIKLNNNQLILGVDGSTVNASRVGPQNFTTAGLLALSPDNTSSGGFNFHEYLKPWVIDSNRTSPNARAGLGNVLTDTQNYYNNSLTLWGLSNMYHPYEDKTSLIKEINEIEPNW
jgi:hypothetical protein